MGVGARLPRGVSGNRTQEVRPGGKRLYPPKHPHGPVWSLDAARRAEAEPLRFRILFFLSRAVGTGLPALRLWTHGHSAQVGAWEMVIFVNGSWTICCSGHT